MWFYFHNDVSLVKMYQRMSVIYFYITMMHTFYGLTCLRKQKGEKKGETKDVSCSYLLLESVSCLKRRKKKAWVLWDYVVLAIF